MQLYNEASIAFVDKVLEISGLGNRTYLPDSMPMDYFYLLMLLSRSEQSDIVTYCTAVSPL